MLMVRIKDMPNGAHRVFLNTLSNFTCGGGYRDVEAKKKEEKKSDSINFSIGSFVGVTRARMK